MNTLQAEVFEAFRSIDITEDKALEAATALGQRDQDVAPLKTDMSVMKWMMGFVLAFQAAIIAKLFIHQRSAARHAYWREPACHRKLVQLSR